MVSLFCEYIHLEYVHIHVIYRVNQAECVSHILVVAPQEYVNIYSTRRQQTLCWWHKASVIFTYKYIYIRFTPVASPRQQVHIKYIIYMSMCICKKIHMSSVAILSYLFIYISIYIYMYVYIYIYIYINIYIYIYIYIYIRDKISG